MAHEAGALRSQVLKRVTIDGAAKGHHLPDRCQAAACGCQGVQLPGEDARGQAAAVLPSHCQTAAMIAGPTTMPSQM